MPSHPSGGAMRSGHRLLLDGHLMLKSENFQVQCTVRLE
jgi:hypothetical protein